MAIAAFMPRFISGSCPTCLNEPVLAFGLPIAVPGRTSVSAASATRTPDHDLDIRPSKVLMPRELGSLRCACPPRPSRATLPRPSLPAASDDKRDPDQRAPATPNA